MKFPKPWFRPSRGLWYVTLGGTQHNLGTDRDDAFEQYKTLLGEPEPTPAQAPVLAPSTSLVGLIQRFMLDVRANYAEETIEWYRHRLQLFMDYLSEKDLEAIQVNELKKSTVREWMNSYPHLAAGSRRNLCRAIQRVFNWAIEDEIIEVSPLAKFKKPKGGKREVVISDDEWQDILSLVRNENLRDLLEITWENGGRPQESLFVEARHVDLQNQRWHFPASESKTDLDRVVYLTERAVEISRRLMDRYSTGPLFRNTKGMAWETDAVNCAFILIQIRMGQRIMKRDNIEISKQEIAKFAKTLKPTRTVKGKLVRKTERALLEEAGRKLRNRMAASLAPKFCAYNIRHTWMNRLLTSGVDCLTVSVLAGHADPTTLVKAYQHISQNPKFLLEQAKRG